MGTAGGAKLNRTETVTVRFDPKLNYLCELASRAQRRTKSSFVEWAVAEALKTVELPEVIEFEDYNTPRAVTVNEKSGELWEVDEAERLVDAADRTGEAHQQPTVEVAGDAGDRAGDDEGGQLHPPGGQREAGRRPREAALGHHRVEHTQQVEVEGPEVHAAGGRVMNGIDIDRAEISLA